MLEEDKCLSHRRNASTINLQNPVQKKKKKKGNSSDRLHHLYFKPRKAKSDLPWEAIL